MNKVDLVTGACWRGLAVQLLSRLFLPFLDWIQVEVTSHCNAECVYCPHTVYRKTWQASHMSIDLFKKLSPAFRRTDLAYLQGWGEPLLHPRFFEMVRIAKGCGCLVGTTTNGLLCNGETAERMVREGLSVVAFSLAGTTDCQDGIRRGAPLKAVMNAIRVLDERKKKLDFPFPQIHVAFLWLRSQLEAVKELPTLMEGTGVSQVVVTTLDFVPHRDLAAEVIHARDENEETFLSHIASEVAEDGERRGLKIAFRLVASHRAPGICTENVSRALFISSRGLVSPCVFRNLPVAENPGAGEIGLYAPGSLTFGDINNQSLSRIWARKAYKIFRGDHARGSSSLQCGDCPKLFSSIRGHKESNDTTP